MRKMGQRVEIKDIQGAGEFAGKRGQIIGDERDGRTLMYRVLFDEAVTVKGLDYEVKDDLFAASYLKTLRAGK